MTVYPYFDRVTSQGAELGEMPFVLFFWWTSVWTLVLVAWLLPEASAAPSSGAQFTLSSFQASFDQAVEACSPGVLASLTNKQDVQRITELLKSSAEKTFWIGLKKNKNDCVTQTHALRGFRWVEDNSQVTQVRRWVKEPKLTCIEARCGALTHEFVRSDVQLGLLSDSCKAKNHFICKQKDRPTGGTPTTTPVTTEPEPTTPQTRPGTIKPSTAALQPSPSPKSESDPCHLPQIPNRSFKMSSLNSLTIQLECWSDITVDLRCHGQPLMWRVLDGSPADFSILCQPCEAGFRKDDLGRCVDIDECGVGAPCQHTCINTPGSYRCVCANGTQADGATCGDADQNNNKLSGLLVPVLVGTAALILLVVVVVVTVKCCMMRRSRKRAKAEAEKMRMRSSNGRDSFATANEKEAR
uniref:C-type lectin domain-containing protein n=2 Tax=Oryzias melastigma TaxID=30732 RepID=A0A3B3CMY3_ORYME